MTPLSKREFSRMGVIGPDESITKLATSALIHPAFMAVIDPATSETAQQVDLAMPGDLIVIATDVTLDPRQTLVAGEYCPFLHNVGEVNGQRFFFPDHSGLLKVVVRVTREFRLDQLPYLIRLISLGEFK